jgi:hypothetical protein
MKTLNGRYWAAEPRFTGRLRTDAGVIRARRKPAERGSRRPNAWLHLGAPPPGRIIRMLKEHGFTIVLVEQNFRFAATVADQYYVMEHGRVVEGFAQAELDANRDKLQQYLGV